MRLPHRFKMGQTNSSQYNVQERIIKLKGKSTPPPDYHLPPLQFHTTHGENIRISEDGFTANRVNSFCNGIIFSNRPIMVGERIYLQLAESTRTDPVRKINLPDAVGVDRLIGTLRLVGFCAFSFIRIRINERRTQ